MKPIDNASEEFAPQPSSSGQWLTSKQTQKHLKCSDCALMHMRLDGKLIYKKQGNAFLYFFEKNTSQ